MHDPAVGVVPAPRHQAGRDAAVDQTDRAVVPQHQVLGDVADRRPAPGVTADRQQQLMLCRGDADVVGPFGAPRQEPPQLIAELEQPGVILVS